jgi:anti-sigma factor RsiW
MFTFRNDDSMDTALSRYLDGEMLPHERARTEERIQTDPDTANLYRRLETLSMVLSDDPSDALVAGSSERVRRQLDWELARHHVTESHAPTFAFWHRNLSIPLPVVAAASVLFLVMAVGLIVSPVLPSAPERSVADLAGSRTPVNVQVQVGGPESDLLMRWLEEQNSVGQVTIQLPEDAEFRLRGEPVLMRPDFLDSPEDGEEHEIVPLEVVSE